MTSADMVNLKSALESRQCELFSLLRRREVIAAGMNGDRVDQMHNSADRDVAADTAERAFMRLQEVQSALKRVQTGTFGSCLQCGHEIKLKRLAAVPWTEFCLDCQELLNSDRFARVMSFVSQPFKFG